MESGLVSLQIGEPTAGVKARIRALARRFLVFGLFIAAAGIEPASAQEASAPALGSLPEVEFTALSQPDPNPIGVRALTIRPLDWKHGETRGSLFIVRDPA